MCSHDLQGVYRSGRTSSSNQELEELVDENAENLTMSWSWRDIFGGGKKDVRIIGPIEGVSEEVVKLSRQYWSLEARNEKRREHQLNCCSRFVSLYGISNVSFSNQQKSIESTDEGSDHCSQGQVNKA